MEHVPRPTPRPRAHRVTRRALFAAAGVGALVVLGSAARELDPSAIADALTEVRSELGLDGSVDVDGAASGSVSGGTQVTLNGSGLSRAVAVSVAGVSARIVSQSDEELVFTTPPAEGFAEAEAEVVLTDADGVAIPTPVPTFSYRIETAVDRQLAFVLANYDADESEEFGHFEENDCANFASQSLLARGWEMDEDWWYSHDLSRSDLVSDDGEVAYGAAWISSTALMNYVLDHPERGTALDDSERDRVALGDIVQFDWDRSGDRDHTGIVTRIETDADGTIAIYYAGHTDDTDFRSVDWAITEYHPGAAAHYWSVA